MCDYIGCLNYLEEFGVVADNDSEVGDTIQEIIVAEDGIEYYLTGEDGN